ncbi:hypothetical protein J2Y69_003596 [Microbacterium resistens]|uniref:Uncharacterized protein n=1 Tax=Microbacterium resistens TaxID=156977 RepID=A0ABU1SI26_9MICO|nr:hypothetical protein [Microbacterium resistens]MDR6868968.1 hypothetical protein [Microbacterium resistens]
MVVIHGKRLQFGRVWVFVVFTLGLIAAILAVIWYGWVRWSFYSPEGMQLPATYRLVDPDNGAHLLDAWIVLNADRSAQVSAVDVGVLGQTQSTTVCLDGQQGVVAVTDSAATWAFVDGNTIVIRTKDGEMVVAARLERFSIAHWDSLTTYTCDEGVKWWDRRMFSGL